MKEISLDDLKILVESLDDEDAPLPILNEEKEEYDPLIVESAKEAQKNMFKSLLTEIKQNENEIERLKEESLKPKNIVEAAVSKLPEIKEQVQEDPLLKEKVASLSELQAKQNLLIERLQRQLGSLGGGGEVNLRYLDDIVGVATNLSGYNGKFLKVDTSNSAQPFVFETVSGGGGGGSYTGTQGQLLQHDGSDYVGVSSVGLATYFNDYHQGYYRYSTHYYSSGIANTVQTLPEDVFVMIQPSVRTNKVDFLPEKMLIANNNDPWIGAGATVGTGQTEFSLAGLDDGSTVIVRIASLFNPDIDFTNVDFALNFTTNPTTQGYGTTHFSIVREQGLICNEGADQDYLSETLINFYVGSSLSGLTTDTAGSFNLSVRASDGGDFEMLALTINVVA